MTEAGHFEKGAWIRHICKTCQRFSKLHPHIDATGRYGRCKIPHDLPCDYPIVRIDEYCKEWEG